jgi:hypothetical protein
MKLNRKIMPLNGRQRLNLRDLFLSQIRNDAVYRKLDKKYGSFATGLYTDIAPPEKLAQMVKATITAAAIPQAQQTEARSFLVEDFHLCLDDGQAESLRPKHYTAMVGFIAAGTLALDVWQAAALLERFPVLDVSSYVFMALLVVFNLAAAFSCRQFWYKAEMQQLRAKIDLEVEEF